MTHTTDTLTAAVQALQARAALTGHTCSVRVTFQRVITHTGSKVSGPVISRAVDQAHAFLDRQETLADQHEEPHVRVTRPLSPDCLRLLEDLEKDLSRWRAQASHDECDEVDAQCCANALRWQALADDCLVSALPLLGLLDVVAEGMNASTLGALMDAIQATLQRAS